MMIQYRLELASGCGLMISVMFKVTSMSYSVKTTVNLDRPGLKSKRESEEKNTNSAIFGFWELVSNLVDRSLRKA